MAQELIFVMFMTFLNTTVNMSVFISGVRILKKEQINSIYNFTILNFN